jgi:hypothetical protein
MPPDAPRSHLAEVYDRANRRQLPSLLSNSDEVVAGRLQW